MPVPLSRIVEDHFRDTVIGPPTYDATGNLPNMVVYPLYPAALGPEPPGMITLSQGLRRGVRLTDTGLVSQVHVDNPLAAPVLVGESEILEGPTQRRSVQISCVVPPFRRASLPVNCVEAGQPTQYQAEFTGAAPCPWYLRSFKMEQLAHHGESHQHRIWERIRDYLHHAGATSGTQDVGAVFATHGPDVDSLAGNFPLEPGQTGAICAVGQDVFVELYSDPELLEDQYDQVLRSALVEAVAHPTREVTPPEQVGKLPNSLAFACRHSRTMDSRSLSDGGRSQVFAGDGVSGSALVSGGRLVHLAAHKRYWGFGRPFADQVGELGQQRRAWLDENRAFAVELGRQYARRQREYDRFRRGLSPQAVPHLGGVQDLQVDDDGPFADPVQAPPPVPLSEGTFGFFLRLFRKG